MIKNYVCLKEVYREIIEDGANLEDSPEWPQAWDSPGPPGLPGRGTPPTPGAYSLPYTFTLC